MGSATIRSPTAWVSIPVCRTYPPTNRSPRPSRSVVSPSRSFARAVAADLTSIPDHSAVGRLKDDLNLSLATVAIVMHADPLLAPAELPSQLADDEALQQAAGHRRRRSQRFRRERQ